MKTLKAAATILFGIIVGVISLAELRGDTGALAGLRVSNYLMSDGQFHLKVGVYGTDGALITSFGGGTQVAESNEFSAHTPATMMGGRDCGNTTERNTDVIEGDVFVPCGTDDGVLGFQLIAPGGAKATLTADAQYDQNVVQYGPQGMLAYRSDLSGTAGVADGKSTRALGDDLGRALRGAPCPSGNMIDGQLTNTDGASTSVIAAQGANKVVEVWEVDLMNTSATAGYVDIRDGTAGAVLRSFPLSAGGGVSRTLNVPIRFTANTIVAADTSAALTSVIISLAGCVVR